LALAVLVGACSPALPRFERALAAHDSATAALGEWCAARGIAEPPTIRAIADRAAPEPASTATLAALGVGPAEPIAFRHVRLMCGDKTLSDAKNWFVPARLTTAMNRTLETTDIPFGKVVAPLGFRRERLAAQRGRSLDCPFGTVLSHRAVLRLADGRAIALVAECYTRANLGKGR
jgi:hypothetical protein